MLIPAVNSAAAATETRRKITGRDSRRRSRKGCSTNLHDSVASAKEAKSSTSLVTFGEHPLMSRPSLSWNTISGQCHRYKEYEIIPMNTTGRRDKALPTTDPPDFPAAMTKAAPTHGSNAATPGNGVAGVNNRPAVRIRMTPESEARLRSKGVEIAGKMSSTSMVPSKSSQALV